MTPHPRPDEASRAEELRGKVVGILFRHKMLRNYVKGGDATHMRAFGEIESALLTFAAQAAQRERDALKAAQAALQFVVEREDYTFAECALAEQIVYTCKDALDIVNDAFEALRARHAATKEGMK